MNIFSFTQTIFYLSLALFFLSVVWVMLKKKKINFFHLNLNFNMVNKKKDFKSNYNHIDKKDTIYNALIVYPELENYLYYVGLKSIKNPIVKKTFAKKTTFEKVARSLGKDPDKFVEEINIFIDENVA